MRRVKLAAIMGGAAMALLFAVGEVEAITYTGYESFGGATVDLSITTDGTIGALSESNITAFNIDITDSSGTADLTKMNSGTDFFGGAFQATSTDLLFDFDTPGFAFALFQLNGYGSSDAFWCPGTKDCFPGNSAPAIGVSTQPGDTPVEQESESGTVVLATVPSAAPEPTTWALMVAGIGGIGLMLRRAKRTFGFRSAIAG